MVPIRTGIVSEGSGNSNTSNPPLLSQDSSQPTLPSLPSLTGVSFPIFSASKAFFIYVYVQRLRDGDDPAHLRNQTGSFYLGVLSDPVPPLPPLSCTAHNVLNNVPGSVPHGRGEITSLLFPLWLHQLLHDRVWTVVSCMDIADSHGLRSCCYPGVFCHLGI